jgi:hypothetical protein
VDKLEMWGLNMLFVVGGDGSSKAAQVRPLHPQPLHDAVPRMMRCRLCSSST